MVANINKMMYVGEKPWHGLGTRLDNVATSAEAIVASGLGWEVKKEQIFFKRDNLFLPFEREFATVRTDKNIPLGIVGEGYSVLQNKDAFKFFDAVVGEKLAMYHTAGSLGKGERTWILAKLPNTMRIAKEDNVDKFLLLSNSHDGFSAVQMMFTPIRVVCQNTLNLAINTAGESGKVYLRHTINLGLRIDEAREALGLMNRQFQIFEELSKKLVKIQMNQKDFSNYLTKIGIISRDDDGKMSTRTKNNFDTLVGLYEHGKGNDMVSVKGTAWAGMNAVVEYVDYVRAGSEENRAKSVLYGSGAALKQKAWDEALVLVK